MGPDYSNPLYSKTICIYGWEKPIAFVPLFLAHDAFSTTKLGDQQKRKPRTVKTTVDLSAIGNISSHKTWKYLQLNDDEKEAGEI